MIGQAGLAFNNFIVVAVIVTTLYFAREILVPIALAVLLSFCGFRRSRPGIMG